MKKNILARAGVLAVAAALTFSVAGCGSDKKADAPVQGQEEKKEMTEEEYKAKVQELYDSIQTESTSAMEGVDQTDMTALVEATKSMVEKVKPFYEELAGLEAPETYAESQAKIKEGADASVEMLSISLELMEMATDSSTSDADKQTKAAELQEKATDLATKAQSMADGLAEVIDAAE